MRVNRVPRHQRGLKLRQSFQKSQELLTATLEPSTRVVSGAKRKTIDAEESPRKLQRRKVFLYEQFADHISRSACIIKEANGFAFESTSISFQRSNDPNYASNTIHQRCSRISCQSNNRNHACTSSEEVTYIEKSLIVNCTHPYFILL